MEVAIYVSRSSGYTCYMISAHILERLDNAGIACFVKRADGSYSFINQAGAEMLGLQASEILGRSDVDLFKRSNVAEMMGMDHEGFWQNDMMSGGVIGVSIADEQPSPEQLKVLGLMKTIVTEATSEVVAQFELLSGQQTIH